MLRRLLSLYYRFAAANLYLRGRPAPIPDAHGHLRGHVDRLRIQAGRLVAEGWTTAVRVRLVVGGQIAECAPALQRDDVAAVHEVAPLVGFRMDLPAPPWAIRRPRPPTLYFDMPGDEAPVPPVTLRFHGRQCACLKQPIRFSGRLVLAIPAILAWFRRRHPAQQARVKRILKLEERPAVQPLSSTLFSNGKLSPQRPLPPDVTIVMPVHNAHDVLRQALERIARHTDLPWRMVLVDDASTDTRVLPLLTEWAARQHRGAATCLGIEVIRLGTNQGFVRAANTGLARALGVGIGPIVIMNSDVLVPEGWARRLAAPLVADRSVASVTPMSSDAEILTAPIICEPTELRPGQAEAMDKVAHQIAPGSDLADLPTGVGCCMALDRDWLRRFPSFDTDFGKGYGEEVDWSQRVRMAGGRHLGLASLFMEHRGAASFGAERKRRQIAKHNALIAARHPAFPREVDSFIRSDPLSSARLALALAWAGSLDPERRVPIYLAHSMGGGAEVYLSRRIAADVHSAGVALVLRVGRPRRWRIELHSRAGLTSGETDDTALMRRLVGLVPRRHLVYSNGVGDPDPFALPGVLLSLAGPDDWLEMLFHDYFPLSPSYTLLDSRGRYRGPARPDLASDPAHATYRPDGTRIDLRDWQATWRRLAEAADDLCVFAQDGRAQIEAVWPELADKIRVRPHAPPCLTEPVPRLPPAQGPTVLGVLGSIGRAKGAEVVAALATVAPPLPLVVIGEVDPAIRQPGNLIVHGPYRTEEICALARRYRITHWLIPSIWPETFSFTTHEALATGLPVLAFDLGAQGEAVRAAPNGRPMPFDPDQDHVAVVRETLRPRAQTRMAG